MDNAALLTEIDRHFLDPDRIARVENFQRAGRGLFGWFKGETAHLFQNLAAGGQLRGWHGDAPITEDGKKWCDLRADTDDGPLWLEVKALRYQQRTGLGADLLSRMTDAIGVTDDVVRLLRVSEGTPMILLFVYPRPDAADWAGLLESYGKRIFPISVTEQSTVSDYPDPLYISKLTVEGF
ncbi:MAG: hypothetical protein ACE5FA_09020 [Dehalococcoidia bacterium]